MNRKLKSSQGWEIMVARDLVKRFRKKWKCLRDIKFNELVQQCLEHGLSKMNKYDSARGASEKTFLDRVISL